MSDRKNHNIMFGPEWLRNMSPTEQNRSGSGQARTGAQSRSSPAEPGATGGQAPGALTTPTPTMATNARNARQSRPRTPKRRYGREELLSFCERSGDPPDELRSFELLYQTRQKKPVALSYGEEEVRGNLRSGLPIGISPTERFGGGRSVGRPTQTSETRGRTRMPFVRHAIGQSVGRANATPPHAANVRSAGFLTPEEEGAAARPWSANNGGVPVTRPGEQGEWSQSKLFRRRPNNLTNWRQTSRDEGDEWRNSPENNGRPRTHLDKWDRDWNDNERRPTQERQSWGNNRRTWAGNDAQNEDNLPEWAMDNAEARAGTFDASGAFHGYTNDDSNIPQPQESNYALSRSHTHGGFSHVKRSLSFEDGPEEWWASEKANKLSPKRFDTGEHTSKMASTSSASDEQSNTSVASLQNEAASLANIPEKPLEVNPQPSTSKEPMEDQTKALGQQFPDSKPFGATLHSNKGFETNDESGNFQSVMINQNNSLRQQHQNITPSNNNQHTHRIRGLYDLIRGFPMNSDGNQISEFENPHNILNELMGLTLTEDNPLATTMNVQTLPNTKNTHQPLQMQQASNNAAGFVPNMSAPNMPALNMPAPNMPAPNMPAPNMPASNMPAPNMPAPNMPAPNMAAPNMAAPNMAAPNMAAPNMAAPNMATPNMATPNMATPAMATPNIAPPIIQMGISSDGMDSQNMTRNTAITVSMTKGMNPGLVPGLTTGITPGLAPGLAPVLTGMNSGPVQVSARETTSMPTIGVQNPALNSALGLSRMRNLSMPVDATLPSLLKTHPMNSSGPPMHSRRVMGPFQATDNLQTMPLNNSLFMEHANAPLQQPIPTTSNPIQNAQNPYPIGMQRNVNETMDLVYESILQQHNHNIHNDLTNQWYYEDPNEIVRGPFTSSQMMYWYDAGFFSPALMVRRACEPHLRPLGSYGPLVPFAFNMELPTMLPPQYEQRRAPQELMNRPVPEKLHENLEVLWGATGAPQVWPQQRRANYRGEDAVNNLPPFFWNGPNANMMNLPMDIVKGMKTEDQILAQLKAKQNAAPPENIPFLNCRSPTTTSSSTNISTSDDSFNIRATPELEKLQQLLQSDTQTLTSESKSESEESETKCEKPDETEKPGDPLAVKTQSTLKVLSETKSTKQAKSEAEKPVKTKDSNNTSKTKNKKNKEDKKDETEAKIKEEEVKPESASVETSPTKSKKEEKLSKKEIEKEKKEWIKEGFTIVKGAEKNNNKENKKKMEEAKMVEELEIKMKEEEKLASEEEKKKKPVEMDNKKEMDQQQRQISDSLAKRAPWSVSTQSVTSNRGGLTLSEIQRLEREKKLEQIKEQQHMMHLIAQQQAAALAREQEMQANLAWAKNNLANNGAGPSLAEIQAETRRQSAAAAATATLSIEEVIPLPPLPTNLVPWGTSTNGGGFWDTQAATPKPEKPEEPVKLVKPSEPKSKKKVTASVTSTNPTIPKREPSPTSEFEAWCSTVLALWRTKIDVPTFVGFLKDIESPYEVKDYVKCYLGDSKDSSDFARQFLERRSKLLRVGMVTPSDDLCSPAIAINPRAVLSDFQEVKGKGKKSKKNKMLKVDARILGFSVTASEDRINVGDIDTV